MSLSGLTSYLEKFSYPNINFLSDEEVDDIFSVKNRLFLLNWIFQQMGIEYANILNESNNLESLLTDLVCENSFCKPTQKIMFVKGDSKLSVKEQFNILARIFNHLEEVSVKNEEPKNFELKIENLDKDINLFPKKGLLRVCSAEERNKILQIQNDYKELNYYEKTDSDCDDTIKINDIKTISKNVCQTYVKLFPNFTILENVSKQLENKTVYNLLPVPGSEIVIPKCSKNVEGLLEYIRSVDIIAAFEKDETVKISKQQHKIIRDLLLISSKFIDTLNKQKIFL